MTSACLKVLPTRLAFWQKVDWFILERLLKPSLTTEVPHTKPRSAPRLLLFVVNDAKFFLSHRLGLALAAQNAGYQVAVAAPESSAATELKQHGLSVVPIRLNRFSTNPFDDWRLYRDLRSLYRTLRPAIVHHVTIKPILYGSLAAIREGTPCLVNAVSGLGHTFTSATSKNWLKRNFALRLYRLASKHRNCRLIVQNPDDADFFRAHNLIDAQRISLIPGTAIDTEKLQLLKRNR